jgi:hypothetical protein
MVRSLLLGKAVKGLLGCPLAAGVFWWVVEHNGPREGTVTLHVLEPGVEVSLAGRVYFFQETNVGPFVLRLRAGKYDFRVRRGDTVLHSETFTLRAARASSSLRSATSLECSPRGGPGQRKRALEDLAPPFQRSEGPGSEFVLPRHRWAAADVRGRDGERCETVGPVPGRAEPTKPEPREAFSDLGVEPARGRSLAVGMIALVRHPH